MKTILACALSLLLCPALLAQRHHKRLASPDHGAADTTQPAVKPPPKKAPRPYAEVITKEAVSQTGLFTIHRVDDKYYFEIPDSLLGREILAVTRFSKVAGGVGVYGGEIANQQTLKFERGPADNVFLRVVALISQADSTDAIYKAVVNSSLNPIVAAFPIAAYGKDSASLVIDVTDFFKGDDQVVSLTPAFKRKYNLGSLSADRSYIKSIHTYPINTEIVSVKTFSSNPPATLTMGTGYFPAAVDAGAVTLEMHTSLLLLPETPMRKRLFDPRVGYFADQYEEYGDSQQKMEKERFILRWRLEPRPEDMDKYKRGELVEPARPIVIYIDPATPPKWRPYLIAGINDWQKAFEKAGFKNAIVGKEWPVNDSTMSLEDARFSVLRYFASPIANAYGPNVHDPRSGEILESHIGWYHNVMELVHDWFFIQCAAVDPNARKMTFSDSLMGQLIRFVSSHEVGHALGLQHNFGSSSTVPVEKLRDKAWLDQHGHTPSIMDYARFDYVAQPEDSIPERDLFPRIGEYDKWAIQWGYTYTGAGEQADKKITNRWIVDSLKNPRLWFGPQRRVASDPRSQSEDLGDDDMKANSYGIRNLRRVLDSLPQWTRKEGDLYTNLDDMYAQVVKQYFRYVHHVVLYIGGVYVTPRSVEQAGPIYEMTPKALQKEAVAFLQKQVFDIPNWLYRPNINDQVGYPASAAIISVVDNTLTELFKTSSSVLLTLEANTDRFPNGDAYTPDEFLTDMEAGIFSELSSHKPVTSFRRLAQKKYIEFMEEYLPLKVSIGGAGSGLTLDYSMSDVPTVVRTHLEILKKKMDAAIPLSKDRMTRMHLEDLSQRIGHALNPK